MKKVHKDIFMLLFVTGIGPDQCITLYKCSISYDNGNFQPGRIAQSVTCLTTDVRLTADPGVASLSLFEMVL